MKQQDRIKELRQSKGLSQRELAKEISISKSALARLETGESVGTLDVLTKLATFYGVSLDYLTCNSSNTTVIDDLINTFIDNGIIVPGEPISKDTQEIIIKIIETAIKSKRKS